ncbi:MAG: hypothetical protein PVH62_10915 [Anaerolineae bacterium]|jgi:electron transfer flavoprotein beta subunit
MRLIVILGRVLDPRGIVVNRRRGRIFVNREEYAIQPADRCALEVALRIKDATNAEVIVLPRTLLPDDDVLRRALSTGADRAVYLVGETDEADDAMMVGVLAAAVERLGGADLILVGQTTLDTGQSQLGVRLAEALNWPEIVGAWQVDADDEGVRVVRQEGNEYVALEVDPPAVVTVVPGALKPRYPDGVRLINVYRGEGEMAEALEQWDVSDLVEKVKLQPLVEIRGKDFPPERERGERARGTPGEMAQAASEALQKQLGR